MPESSAAPVVWHLALWAVPRLGAGPPVAGEEGAQGPERHGEPPVDVSEQEAA